MTHAKWRTVDKKRHTAQKFKASSTPKVPLPQCQRSVAGSPPHTPPVAGPPAPANPWPPPPPCSSALCCWPSAAGPPPPPAPAAARPPLAWGPAGGGLAAEVLPTRGGQKAREEANRGWVHSILSLFLRSQKREALKPPFGRRLKGVDPVHTGACQVC